MCNSEIIKIVKEIQSNDMSRFGELYDVFSVLIRHFENKADYIRGEVTKICEKYPIYE